MKKLNKKQTDNERLLNLESKVRQHNYLIETILKKLEPNLLEVSKCR